MRSPRASGRAKTAKEVTCAVQHRFLEVRAPLPSCHFVCCVAVCRVECVCTIWE